MLLFSPALLLQSIGIHLLAAAAAVLAGLAAALGIWVYFGTSAGKLLPVLLLLLLIPQFVHLQSWIFFCDRLCAPLGLDFSGVPAIVTTIAFSHLPITGGVCLLALLSVPAELAELCFLERQGARAFFACYLPFLGPSLLMAGLLVFLLSVGDYSVPSIFGVPVYALQLFSRYSAGHGVGGVLLGSLPLSALSLALVAALGFLLRGNPFRLALSAVRNPFRGQLFLQIAAGLGALLLLLFLLVPLVSLTAEAAGAEAPFAVIGGSAGQFAVSLLSSAAAGAVTTLLSLALGLAHRWVWLRRAVFGGSLLAFALPAPVTGLLLIAVWNRGPLAAVYRNGAILVVALTARFLFVGMALVFLGLSRIDSDLFDNLRLHYPGFLAAARCTLRLIRSHAAAAFFTVFALGMGEFAVILLVAPPGLQPLSIKIYNYLHYGASETIAILCLSMLAVTLALAATVYALIGGGDHDAA